VAELRLDGVHREPLERQLGGVGVAQPAGMHALLDPGAARQPGHEPAHVCACHRLPPERAEQGSAPVDAQRGPLIQPPLDHGDHRTGAPVPGKFEFFFRDSTHRQRWQTAKGDTLADAKAERAEMVARLHRGERVERTKRTVSEAAQAWLERGRGQRGPWDPVTRERYERIVRRHVLGSADPQRRPLGEMKLRDLTPDHVAEWSQRNEQTLARDTAQLALIALNQIFRFAVRRGWMGANPVACLEPGEKPQGRAGEVRILDERDLGRLVAHAGPYRVLSRSCPTAASASARRSASAGATSTSTPGCSTSASSSPAAAPRSS